MKICVTGHRPDKLGGYGIHRERRTIETARRAFEILEPEEVTTGMALGWDMAVARACMEIGIPFRAAVPFKGQECYWPAAAQIEYCQLLKAAWEVVYVSDEGYEPWKMIVRNHWMVDETESVLALFNGDPRGGTAECVRYSMSKEKVIHNAWELFSGRSEELQIIEYERKGKVYEQSQKS